MGRSLVHVAGVADEGARLDSVLAGNGCYPSRSSAAKAVEEGSVLVNGKPASKKQLVRLGDAIVYELPDDAPSIVGGEPIPLDIRYEDDHLLVLSKQAGLVCHPSIDHHDGTLVNALIFHCGASNLCNVQGDDDRLGIVHRLDRDTTGLMLAAKSDEAGQALMDAIRDKVVDRRYLALCHGVIAHETGMIDAPIARSASERTRMAVREAFSSREAVTTFRVLERFEPGPKDDGYTLVDCKLFTGRTHQIRVHMEFTRHPLVGDPMYTAGSPSAPQAGLGLSRQFLHSFRLDFSHPVYGRDLSFCDALPDDLRTALMSISDRSVGRTAAGEEVFELLSGAPRPCCDPLF